MDKVQKPSGSECCAPPSEPFRFQFVLVSNVIVPASIAQLLKWHSVHPLVSEWTSRLDCQFCSKCCAVNSSRRFGPLSECSCQLCLYLRSRTANLSGDISDLEDPKAGDDGVLMQWLSFRTLSAALFFVYLKLGSECLETRQLFCF
jgi:hypothetical protein